MALRTRATTTIGAQVRNPLRARPLDPDEKLVARAQNGDLTLLKNWSPPPQPRLRTLIDIVANVEEAQDARQETFLNVFVRIFMYIGISSIARNSPRGY